MTQRVNRLEMQVQQLQARQPLSTAADLMEARQISAEMEAGDYVTDAN